MGLSSKQVISSSGLDWKQTLLEAQNLELPKPNLMKKQNNQTQPSEQSLKCPRCDSTNTKFCYYNNYNKSQPRHFCRACKRHWTKGGTLRNVPVGGGRKNKRVKKSTTTTPASSSSAEKFDGGLSSHVAIHQNTPLDQKSIISSSSSSTTTSSLYQALIHPPPPPPLMQLQQINNNNNNLMMNLERSRDFGVGNGIFLSNTSSLTPLLSQNQGLFFPFSTSIETNNPCSVSTSVRSSNNVHNYGEEFKTMEDAAITNTQLWEIPATSSGAIGSSNYWNWEDFDSLVSTDLKDPWHDSDIKP